MNYEQMNNNRLFLSGTVVSQPVFSHEVYGEGFYELFLEVQRLSEQKDVLPITVSERLISEHDLRVGSRISVSGQFRSYNKIEEGRSRLMLTVFVREIEDYVPTKNPNVIELSGYICKPTIYRTTPFAREICDVLLAINRAYNKSDYIPCIAWGRNARYLSTLKVGDRLNVTGRIQSRTYQKRLPDGGVAERTAYEISISRLSTELSAGNSAERRGEPFSAASGTRRPGSFAVDSADRRSEGFAVDSDNRRGEGFAVDSDNRRSEGFAVDSDNRRGEGFAVDSDNRRSEGFAVDSDNRRNEVFSVDSADRSESFSVDSDEGQVESEQEGTAFFLSDPQ